MAIDKSDKLEDINTTLSEDLSPYFTDVFSPGEVKEQLELGKQVKNITIPQSTPKFFIGTGTRTTADGNGVVSITGAGFEPKIIRMRAIYATGGGSRSEGHATSAADQTCDFQYQNGTSTTYSYSSGRLIEVWGNIGAQISRAVFVSFDADGFTMEWLLTEVSTVRYWFELEG